MPHSIATSRHRRPVSPFTHGSQDEHKPEKPSVLLIVDHDLAGDRDLNRVGESVSLDALLAAIASFEFVASLIAEVAIVSETLVVNIIDVYVARPTETIRSQ